MNSLPLEQRPARRLELDPLLRTWNEHVQLDRQLCASSFERAALPALEQRCSLFKLTLLESPLSQFLVIGPNLETYDHVDVLIEQNGPLMYFESAYCTASTF